MKAMIQIPHLELIFFFYKMQEVNLFSFFFAQLKHQGRRKK